MTLGDVLFYGAICIGGMFIALVLLASVVFIVGVKAIAHGDEGDA